MRIDGRVNRIRLKRCLSLKTLASNVDRKNQMEGQIFHGVSMLINFIKRLIMHFSHRISFS